MSRFTSHFLKPCMVLVAMTAGGTGPLLAQQSDFLFERTSLSVGAFNSRIDTDLRIDGETFRGTPIDFEEDLDLEKDPTVAIFGVTHFFGQRHQVELQFNRVSRDRERILTREIIFRDRVFELNLPVVTTFETDTLNMAYTFWLRRKPASGFGVTAGVQWQRLEVSLDALGAVVPLREEADADLPVPLIGFSYRQLVTLNSRFILTATFLPEVHVGDIESGSFISLFGAYEWRLARNLALGASYSLGDLNVEFKSRAFSGDLDYITEGLQVYGRVLF